jgi:hypothetical protein
MMTEENKLCALRTTIGSTVDYKGHLCEIIEILEDGPFLVLRCIDDGEEIQANQFGEAHRRAPETLTVPVFNKGTSDFNSFIARLIERVA